MNEEAVGIWIRRAENDLKTGRDELSTSDPATDTVCFHMQQCCEKYLKAFLVFHGKEHPKTHDLALLIDSCAKLDPSFQTLFEWNADLLTQYAVEVRYDEPIFPTLEEAHQALDLTERVRDFVRDKFREKGFQL
jgi:HEPN domain-containing protein